MSPVVIGGFAVIDASLFAQIGYALREYWRKQARDDERGTVRAGDLAVIPAMVPHGLVNVGEQPVRVVGFFSESEITSTFKEPIQPIGMAELIQGAPAPA